MTLWALHRTVREAKGLLDADEGNIKQVAKSLGLTVPTLRHWLAVDRLPPKLLHANDQGHISNGALLKIAKLSAEGQEKAMQILDKHGHVRHEDLKQLLEGESPSKRHFIAAARQLLLRGSTVAELQALIAQIRLDG